MILIYQYFIGYYKSRPSEMRHCWMNWKLNWVQKCVLAKVFCPLTASITSEVEQNQWKVFSVGCMIWPWFWLFQIYLPVKILIRYRANFSFNRCVLRKIFLKPFFPLWLETSVRPKQLFWFRLDTETETQNFAVTFGRYRN